MNYQVALQIEGNKFYTGNDPVLNNTNKPYLAPYVSYLGQNFGMVYEYLSEPEYLKFLGLYNIKKIVINKDTYPWFGFWEKENIAEIEAALGRKCNIIQDGSISTCDTGEFFVPRFYIPDKIVYAPTNINDELFSIASLGNFNPYNAYYISPYQEINRNLNYKNNVIKGYSTETDIICQTQGLWGEGSLRRGINGMSHTWVYFPFARWKPGGIVYPYIQKKEEVIKKQLHTLE